jgi:two-component system sensor histidine kinase UhpB
MAETGILIVEDSFIVAVHLQKSLENHGYKVNAIVDSGESALKEIKARRPSLVLMDIMLNGKLDGIETAREIKKHFNLPVVYITALSDSETIQRAKITEPYGYLNKPFDDRQIFTTIEMTLYKHAMEVKLRESEERYYSTVKSISDAVVTIDYNFNVLYLNPSAERITGWKIATAFSKPIFDVLLLHDNENGDQIINPLQCSLTGEKDSALLPNLTLVAKNGSHTPIGEGSISPMINDAGFAIGLVLIFKDLTEKLSHKKIVKDLERKSLAALLDGQESERSRIAKDLHDGLGQTLNAIKININLKNDEEKRKQLLSRLIDEAIVESVRISENLLPAKLKDFDLATCLRSFCDEVSNMSSIPVRFNDYGNDTDVEQSQKINFYRIVQEAVNNALKHSAAQVINVQLNIDDTNIQLMIEDDGRGFNKDSRYDFSRHHGLVNMKDRAEIMNGTFTLESDASRGTLIIVEAPLKHKDKSQYAKA